MDNTTTTPAADDTLIQLRAVCPICFRPQATRGGEMVNHGYRRPDGWHQNVNDCPGTGRPHFGTPEGLRCTRRYIVDLGDHAQQRRTDAIDTIEGRLPIRDRKGNPIEQTTPRDRELAAARLEGEARHADALAADIAQRADAWTPREPVALKVKKSTGPLVHFRRPNWGKHCAGSRMGAMRGAATVEREGVTCPKCLERLARLG